MLKKQIVYKDYSDNRISKIVDMKAQFNYEGISFQVELDETVFNCFLYKNEIWYVHLLDYCEMVALAHLSDTFWNAEHIWYYTQDGDVSSAISGAIKEIYSYCPVLFD